MRRADIFVMVTVASVELIRDPEHLLDIEQGVAALALKSLR